MNILVLEPFYTGSHKKWAAEYLQNSRHQLSILKLPGRHWKWRMYGGAVSLARQLEARTDRPDLILATDMLNLASFLGIARQSMLDIPAAVYFHENQITYPWSPADQDIQLKRDNQYGFINFTTALAADAVFFNSPFHLESFLGSLPGFLGQFPDAQELSSLAGIANKSSVLPLGMALAEMNTSDAFYDNKIPVVLWNHRWEYDKNPAAFFQLLFKLKDNGFDFRLIVLGKSYRKAPPIFAEAKDRLSNEILHWGYASDRNQYIHLLHQADILPVTSMQDFFGGSVVEAIYSNCFPLLPDRLAYPMHIPLSERAIHLYNSEEALYQKMSAFIANFATRNKTKTYQHFVAHYDWSTLAPQYDEEMEQVVSTFNQKKK